MASLPLILNKVGYRKEPFVVASLVSQVFYVRDTRNKKRQVVLPGKKRVVGVENPVEEFEYNQSNEVPLFVTSILPVILVSELTPYLRDGRKEDVPVVKRRRKKRVPKNWWSCEWFQETSLIWYENSLVFNSMLLPIVLHSKLLNLSFMQDQSWRSER